MPRGRRRRRLPTSARASIIAATAAALVLGTTVLVPASASTTQPASPQRLESFNLPSPLINTSTPGGALAKGRSLPKVNVLLPQGYDNRPNRRYPVLWLLHGAGGGADNWLANIAELAKGFPGIIVMPDGGLYGMYTNWWNDGQRADPSWATYHLTVLKAAIESQYRIRPGRRWHAIGGISMGGQGALRYAAMLPDYFGSVATFSAAVPNIQAPETQIGLALLAAVDAAPRGTTYSTIFGPAQGAYAEGNSPQALAANYGHTRMYLTSGDGINCRQDPINPSSILVDTGVELVLNRQQAPFAKAASAEGADVTAVTTCGVHTFGVWNRAFGAALAWGLFKQVPDNPTQWVYRTIATTGDMWGLDFHFATPPSAVSTFTRNGNTLTATGSAQVRITSPHGCQLSMTIPFTASLPTPCR